MSRLTWSEPEKRLFDVGVDRGVLYPKTGKAVAWNGLTSIEEAGANEATSYYIDGRPFLYMPRPKEFVANISAYTYPEEFSEIMGYSEIADGMYLDSQMPKAFDLSYRTIVGNAVNGVDHGYKIHLIYNATATPQALSYETMGDGLDPSLFQWDVQAVPVTVPGWRATAHIIIDTRHMDTEVIQALEKLLYGDESTAAHMPTPTVVFDLLNYGDRIIVIDNGDGTFTVEGSYENVYLIGPGEFQVDNVDAINHGDGTFTIQSTFPTPPGDNGHVKGFPADKLVVGWASHDTATLLEDEEQFGVLNGMLSTYADFVNAPLFPTGYAELAAERKAKLLISWEPWDWSLPINEQPNFAPRMITAGTYDEYITSWLSQAEGLTGLCDILVRFAPEMNDTSRPWSPGIGTVGYAEATAQEYIEMWNHVYEIKQTVAPSVQFMWNPLNFGDNDPFENFFPGIENVDILALDGFNWSDVQGTAGWQDPSAVFGFKDATNGPVPRLKALAGSKPWGIAETASAPDNPSDFQVGGQYYDSYGSWVFDYPQDANYTDTADDWITQEGWARTLLRYSLIAGASFVNFFHTVKETDWRLTDTADGRDVITVSSTWDPDIITIINP